MFAECISAVPIANGEENAAVTVSLLGAGLDSLAKSVKMLQLNSVQESLKSRSKIYQLTRTESEVRVNDYNPILLMLWKANIDIQFVAESSLAIAQGGAGHDVTLLRKSRGY